jgi:N-formylglutamate deformylase
VSRLVVDPERFVDDEQEVMASKGMGVIYAKTSDGRDLRRTLSESERKELLSRFYWPHARLMEAVVESALDEHDFCLILDCRSFASHPLPVELDRDTHRPDICIGTDDFHTPPAVVRAMQDLFQSLGWTVAQNRPYAGTYIPLRFLHSDRRLLSIMVEVNRHLYMNKATGLKTDAFGTVGTKLAELRPILSASIYRIQ